MNDRCQLLYTSIVGSHAWGMEHEASDWDYATIYLAPSYEVMTGKNYTKGSNHSGEFEDGVPWDQTFMELGKHVHLLYKGNISQFVTLLAPAIYHVLGRGVMQIPDDRWKQTVTHPQHTQHKLRLIIKENPAKNIFHSINGMTTANLRKYFDEGKRFHIEEAFNVGDKEEVDKWWKQRAKKLAQIERLVRFGFAVLTEQNYELVGCYMGNGSWVDEGHTRQWQQDLIHAYNASDLPEVPDTKPFLDYLFDVRVDNLTEEYHERFFDQFCSPMDDRY